MSSIINKVYQNLVIRYPIGIIFVLVLILGFFSIHAKNFELDASADSLILEDDKDLKIFRKITNRYDTKDFVIITYKPNENLFSENSFKNIKNLKTSLENLENVHEVITLIDLPLLKAANVPLKKLNQDKIKRITDVGIDINLAKKEIVESPIYKNLIVSEDGQLTSLIVNLKRDEQFIELLRKRNDLRAKEKLKIEEEEELKKILLDYDKTTKKRFNELESSRNDRKIFKRVNKKEASELSGIDLKQGGLFFKEAGWINPKKLIRDIFTDNSWKII